MILLPVTRPLHLLKTITCEWQNHSFVSNKEASQAFISNATNEWILKSCQVNYMKLSSKTIRFNLVQVCPSLCAAELFTPSFNVFSGYLYVSPGQSFISKASSQTLFFFSFLFPQFGKRLASALQRRRSARWSKKDYRQLVGTLFRK